MNDSLATAEPVPAQGASGERADAQHPWIGLASFTENDRGFFAGRGDEIEDLLRLVRRDTLTLLYGVSGLGKTSLVQAGLFPALRDENILPVPIRLDYLESARPLAFQIMDAIGAAARTARVEAPLPRPNETLWEYFHREGNHFWSARNDLVTPFLAFDQFEEFFTLGRETPARAAQAAAFMEEFADLVENRPPAALREDPSRAKGFNFKPVPLKVLLAMREDYLADLDRIRSHFRALGQNRLRLLPMGEKQARQVIALGAALLAPGVQDRIVEYVAGGTRDAEMTVAPALLSLVLRELNERRLARGPEAKITPDLLDVEQHKIFEDFYLRTLADFPPNVRLFIEDELLTASGHRNSAALDDALTRAEVTLPVLNELVNRRLLAYEDRHNTRRVELTHDVLVPVIKASRDSRLTREAVAQAERLQAEHIAQRRRQKVTFAIACLLGLSLLATLWGGYYFFVQEHKAYFGEFVKRNGFAEGALPLSPNEARRYPVSFLFIHKGITWSGGRPHWKPAFRVIAVDARLQPTTNHNIGTYLWRREWDTGEPSQFQKRGERLGLHTICQWEFVADADGGIIYERALNRDDEMVTGFIYSPIGSGAGSTRLARFVGPDGFPQLQSSSQAEYISIHYDKDGWEDRVTYRDGKNLPAKGPEAAFGQALSHNARGQLVQLLSLDADEKNTIDNVGNCGLQINYDNNGRMIEARSIGPDLKPMQVKDEWYTAKYENDSFGRPVRITYYGGKGEPVFHKQGYHGVLTQYDEHGNAVVTTYIGVDGKPIILPNGVAIYRSAFNPQGRVTRMTYHGVNNEPVLHSDGSHAFEWKYDERGNIISTTFLGLDGKPALTNAGYASFTSAYDAHSHKIWQGYFGVNGEPLFHKEGNHAWKSEYDQRGNEITATFLGVDDKPTITGNGYAIMRRKYDSDGNELEEAYFDAADKPTLEKTSGIHRMVNFVDGRGKIIRRRFYGMRNEPALQSDGTHGWDSDYDEHGNETITTYVGLDDKPLVHDGLATMERTYDAAGREIRRVFKGVNGEPALYKDGYHGWEAKFDEVGRNTETKYMGLDGKLILNSDGYAINKLEYDARGNLTKGTYFGTRKEPVLSKESYHGWKSQFDARGNRTVLTYLGKDGEPILIPKGYAIWKIAYDMQGREIENSYFGVQDEPVLTKNGYHAIQSQYDERGREIATTYLGLKGKPVTRAEGFDYATVKSEYDARGNQIKWACFGAAGEPVVNKTGYHARHSKFDELGHEVEAAYFAVDGQPVMRIEGYAMIRASYDARGNIIRQTYHGIDGEPVVIKDGYHGWEATYDERGQPTAKVYFDAAGNPVQVNTDTKTTP